jgi:hypothetical protein
VITCFACGRGIDHLAFYVPAAVAEGYFGRREDVVLCHRCPSDADRALLFGLLRQAVELEAYELEEARETPLAEFLTDDAKLILAALRSGVAETAPSLAAQAGVEERYAVEALKRMTEGDTEYPILRRPDLGPDTYEAVEGGGQ